MRNAAFVSILLSSSGMLMMPSHAVAQTVESDAADTQTASSAHNIQNDNEIIVTAQRREERLQDVPISATVFGESMLEQRQIADIKSMYGAVPSLSVTTGLGENHGLFLGLRGLNVQASQVAVDPAVGVYINGLYLARTSGVNVAMVDVERVEVLRGPQGILFGRNTIGGAFNVTTVSPTDVLEGSLHTEVGNYGRIELTGIVNIPVSDTLSTRFVYRRERSDGHVRSTVDESRFGDTDYDYARASVRYTPTDNLEADITVDYFNSDALSPPYKLLTFRTADPGGGANAIAVANGDNLANYVGGDFYRNSANYAPNYYQEFYSATANLTADLGWATLKSISGYRHVVSDRLGDLDGTPYDIFHITGGGNPEEQFSQEFQAYGDAFGDRLSWIVGAYYFEETGDSFFRSAQNFSLVPPVNSNMADVDLLNVKNTSIGPFGQLTLKIGSGLEATAGIRYVRDSRRSDGRFRLVNVLDGTQTCLLPQATPENPLNQLPDFDPVACTGRLPSATYHYVPWTLGLKYTFSPSAMIYGKVTRGYRSGGYANPTGSNVAQLVPFDPETTLTYELGSKLTLLDGLATFSLAGYRTQYDDIQQPVVGVGTGGILVTIVQNVGSARIWGGEAEASLRLGRLRLDGGLGVISPKYTKGPVVGQPFLNTSKLTWSLAANYRIPVEDKAVNLNASYSYRSKTLFSFPIGLLPAEADAVEQGSVGLLNASIVFDVNDSIDIGLWAKNITKEKYYTFVFNSAASAGMVSGAIGDPRTYGISANFRF